MMGLAYTRRSVGAGEIGTYASTRRLYGTYHVEWKGMERWLQKGRPD
jgi:hypothetical protein